MKGFVDTIDVVVTDVANAAVLITAAGDEAAIVVAAPRGVEDEALRSVSVVRAIMQRA